MTGLRNDARFALRGLLRAPGFTMLTIGTLALGIGATTAIFTVVNGVLLKPLPFEDPDELVGVWNGTSFSYRAPMSTAQYFTYRDENRVFEDIGLYLGFQAAVTGLAEPEQLDGMAVTAGLLPLLRARPVIGRRFSEEDDSPGAPETIMLSYGYWQRQFGADPAVIGTKLRMNGTQREIIGVLPSEFPPLPSFRPAAIYIPFRFNRAEAYFATNYLAFARLLPGVTTEQAHGDMARMIPLLGEQFPGPFAGVERPELLSGFLLPLKQDFVGDVGNVLWVLFGTVGIILLIACANAANLFLVRAEGRQQEIAVRTAIGMRPPSGAHMGTQLTASFSVSWRPAPDVTS